MRLSTCCITADGALCGLLHHMRPEGVRVLRHSERVCRVDGATCKLELVELVE